MTSQQTYDRRTQFLHWASAAAILVLWVLAQTWGYFPKDMRPWLRNLHILIGLILVVFTAWRLQWQFTGATTLPPAESGLLGLVVKAGKLVIYALILATLLFGIGFEAARSDTLFGLGHLPSIDPGDRSVRHFFGSWHGLLANGLLILAGLHGLAALWHRFVRHDGVLNRMIGRGGA